MKSGVLKARDLTYIGLAVALLSVCAWISIPFTIPFTLQTFAVFTVIGLLGTARSAAAILTYILLGAMGAPVFSNFTGGVGALLGNTGGYLIGFVLSALIAGPVIRRFPNSTAAMAAGMAAGLILCYAFGTAWFLLVYTARSGAVSLAAALGWCVLPFIVPDMVKIALAVALTRRLRGRLSV